MKMKKKLLSLLLTAAMVISMCPTTLAHAEIQTDKTWDGTSLSEPTLENNIYQIGSGAELAWFANHVNELSNADSGLVSLDAVLTDDIHLGSHAWTPIGQNAYGYITDAYAGTFDGQNHTVSGLKIDTTESNYGLFSLVNTGTVKNLKVEGNVNSTGVVGGIIGKLQTGTIENCSMSGSVSTTGKTTKGYAGGIIGTITGTSATIKGCCNTASVTGAYAGGILGCSNQNKYTGTTVSCYNTGTITSTNTSSLRSGGIAGQQSKGTLLSCYSIGESTNGICGFSNATITNCYYLEEKTSDKTTAPGGTPVGNPEPISDAESLLTALNSGTDELFAADTAHINNGYPVLAWQLSSAVRSVPVTTVRFSGETVTGQTLTALALGDGDESATNTQYQWAISEDGKTFSDIDSAVSNCFDIPDNAEYAGKYLRVTVTGEEESTAYAISSPIAKSSTLVRKENEESVNKALSSLSLDTNIIKAAGTLKLPATHMDCQVRWASSNPSIISDNGVVTLPDKNIVSVTLTATVTCGTATDNKKFTIDVWSANVDAEVYLQKALDSMKWDFKLLQPAFGTDTNILAKFKSLLKDRGLDGISVTIKSTADENLVSQNGKIFYPAIPEGGSFADGKQVQVFFQLSLDGKSVTYPESDIYSLLIPWDTADVKASLENSANTALAAPILLGDNDSLSSVVSDLTLPSCIDGDRYSFAQITWNSSDESHLAISNEKRQSGADSLYQPYIGKIYQDNTEHEVTLTATVKNPSTDIKLTKTFTVFISPLSDEQITTTLKTMEKILACYTAEKLTDYVTKETLDTTAVENDIQLVTPKQVVSTNELADMNYGKYWDYWNYKFTVSSSDTNVIDINSFRAYVYRPLGEDSSADKPVRLTVKMTSKSNPNLSVTKTIPVTVKHLTRAEINRSLDFMDRAKTGYAKGLLGTNTDAYSVIDNLTPYKEIVWNTDSSDIGFIYRHDDMRHNGIAVDELPGWEAQEDWRLFRTSDKDLLSNETLILNRTPAKNTFVKINSVLTDEILGKYYTKFREDSSYDAEALEKFRQLYKQPVSAYVMAVGAGNYTESFTAMAEEEKASIYKDALNTYKKETDKPIHVTFTLLGLNGSELIAKTEETSFTKGATVFDVFQKILDEHNIPYTAQGSYVSQINGLSEFTHGDNSGWMYTVGDVYVNSYMNAQELSGGEDIVVRYVTDYTKANNKGENPGGDNITPTTKPTSKPGITPTKKPNIAPTPKASPTPTIRPKKKKIKILKLTKYKKGTKRIIGKTIKKSKIVVKIGKKKYTVKSNKKGRFIVKLKKKLKKRNKITVTVYKKGYKQKRKIFKVK